MGSWKVLPFELWLLIYDNIDSVEQLKQCRLVCKGWDYPAESAMLTKPIKISSKASALALYDRLNINHARRQLIKNLYIDIEQSDTTEIILLISLAFSPSMEQLKGFIAQDRFYMTLARIARESPRSFAKLRTIPISSFDQAASPAYLNALLTFKDSLQDMRLVTCSIPCIDSARFYSQLGDFKRLTKLVLLGIELETFLGLEMYLQNCSHLEDLTLDVVQYPPVENESAHQTLSILRERHIQQINSLKTLHVNFCLSDLYEYLAYKYPRIEKLIILSGMEPSLDLPDYIDRLTDAIQSIPHVEITFRPGDMLQHWDLFVAERFGRYYPNVSIHHPGYLNFLHIECHK